MSNLILTLALWISSAGHADAGAPYDYGQWQQVLTSSVDDNGRVDYAGLKADPTHLDAFVARLAVSGPDSTPEFFTTKADSFAFWLNAYNALVVSGVVEAYPVASVKDISLFYGFFKRKSFRVDRRDLTLDDIEHGILRPGYRDPRIHAAINCGAKSCPRLLREAFLPARVDSQLQGAMTRMIRSPEHVRLDPGAKALYLSQIFNWFQSDFTDWLRSRNPGTDPTLRDYIALFWAENRLQTLPDDPNLKIVFEDYDWSLNEQQFGK